MGSALVRQEQPMAAAIEQVVIAGDLKALSPVQRVEYYNRVCQSVGLNPYTRPFEYITLNGKLTLYARRDAADQLRAIRGISLSKPQIEYTDDTVVVTIEAADRDGRTDADLGAVSIKGLQGEAKANALLKAITKAKRRVTLSLAGLGWLDETEVETIPGAQRANVDANTGEIIDVDFGMGNGKQDDVPWEEKRNIPWEEKRKEFPTDAELEILGTWATVDDAYAWAVENGACKHTEHARNSLGKLVTEQFNGVFRKSNAAAVYLAVLRHWQEKIEQSKQPELIPA